MKHASTRRLYDYWNFRRGNRPAPERGDIDPADIRQSLGDTFLLAADFVGELRFRLAGTRICALFGREIKGEAFAALWSEDSRTAIESLTAAVTGEAVGSVAGLRGRTAEGVDVDLEMLILPLAHVGHARIRALGILVAAHPPYWLGDKPVVELDLGSMRHIGSGIGIGIGPVAPRGMAEAEGGRERPRLVVHEGGRSG